MVPQSTPKPTPQLQWRTKRLSVLCKAPEGQTILSLQKLHAPRSSRGQHNLRRSVTQPGESRPLYLARALGRSVSGEGRVALGADEALEAGRGHQGGAAAHLALFEELQNKEGERFAGVSDKEWLSKREKNATIVQVRSLNG